MDTIGWAAFAAVAAAALIIVSHIYRRREPPGHGRRLLTALRWTALSLLILLLFDPELPMTGHAAGGGTQIILDASLSMRLPVDAESSQTRWQASIEEAERLAGGRDVLLFGESVHRVAVDALAEFEPDAPASRLYPALRAASESGARRVVVVTDGGIEDGSEVSRQLSQLGVDVEFRTVGERGVHNRALSELEHPDWVEEGEAFEVRIGVSGTGPGGDALSVSVREGDQTVAETSLEAPPEGRVATATLSVEPEAPEGGGLVRYDVVLEPTDAAPDDNTRTFYVHVGERPTGIAIVSFRPDWEPRFLQPVLEQALGLPVRGYLQAAPDQFVRIDAGGDAGEASDDAAVREALEEAELVVLHGLSDDAPAWAHEAASQAERVLIFPAEDASSLELPVSLAAASAGEWYPTASLPASPVAPLLASIEARALPPLHGVRPIAPAGRVWGALEASPGRDGAGSPVVVAAEESGRRWAIATAKGYWRWAFRSGEPRQAYRRLWAAIGGWLIEDEPALSGDAVRPEQRVWEQGETMRWLVPGIEADSVALQLRTEDGAVAADTVIEHIQGESVESGALPPDHYRYTVTAFAGGAQAGQGEGVLSVETYSPEFARSGAALEGFTGRGAAGTPIERPGRPLHTTPWPYLLFVGLVSTEWVLRRRWGLR